MPSSSEYLTYVLEQLDGAEDIYFRKMMGEYIIYKAGRIIGGIYDDRFLVKPTPGVLEMMPEAELQEPYDGAKPMILVEDIDDKDFMKKLVDTVYSDLCNR